MSKIQITLNEEKIINGKKFPAGTVMGIFEAHGNFNAQVIDKAMQLGQLKVSEVRENKQEKSKDK